MVLTLVDVLVGREGEVEVWEDVSIETRGTQGLVWGGDVTGGTQGVVWGGHVSGWVGPSVRSTGELLGSDEEARLKWLKS